MLGSIFRQQMRLRSIMMILCTLFLHNDRIIASTAVWRDLLRTADSLSTSVQYDSAITLASRALSEAERSHHTSDTVAATIIFRLGTYQFSKNDLREAEKSLRRSLIIRDSLLPAIHVDIAASCYELGRVYLVLLRLDETERLFTRATQIRIAIFGPNSPEVARGYIGQSSLRRLQLKYSESEELSHLALVVFQRDSTTYFHEMRKCVTILGDIAKDQAKYGAAIRYYSRGLALMESRLGVGHPETGTLVNRLATVYDGSGRYTMAEPLYRRALQIFEKSLGASNQTVASVMINLAGLYADIGRSSEADELFARALPMLENAVGKDNAIVGKSLLFIAGAQADRAHAVKNLKNYQRALAIFATDSVAMGPDYGKTLLLMGNANMSLGRFHEAESALVRAIPILERAVGNGHPSMISAILALAILNSDLGNHEKAEPLFQRALSQSERVLGTGHPIYAEILERYARHCRLQHLLPAALNVSVRAFALRKKTFSHDAVVMSERDALSYSERVRNAAAGVISAYLDSIGQAGFDSVVVSIALASKGQVSDEIFQRQQLLAAEVDPETSERADVLRSIKARLSELYANGPDERDGTSYKRKLDSLTRASNDVESDLARLSSPFRTNEKSDEFSAERIVQALPANAALVEYLRVERHQKELDSTIPLYVAILLAPSSSSLIVNLGPAAPIDSLITQYRRHINRIAKGSAQPSESDNSEYASIAASLVKAIWAPIESAMPDTGMLFISPDGLLDLVSFAGLPSREGGYLIEQHAIQYLSSARDLLRFQKSAPSGSGLLAMGDPDFNATTQQRREGRDTVVDTTLASSLSQLRSAPGDCLDLAGINVQRLPGTRTEIDLIGKLWRGNGPDKLWLCTGATASEENFKRLAPGSRMIHLATHGYYAPANCGHNESESDQPGTRKTPAINPLLTSGLFFAGVNNHRSKVSTPDDGILTAEEVSALNLNGTQRVVLSACESGLGEIAAGEGVYGLRRAFLMAGARTVVSSLWPVPDNVTSQLISSIYRENKLSAATLLRDAMLRTLQRERKRGQPDHPFSWASFISIGDWRN